MTGHKMLKTGTQSNCFDRDMAATCPAHMPLAEFAALPEAARLAEIRAASLIPVECGPDIVPAPARGAFATFRPIEMVPGSAGAIRPSGFRARGEDAPRRAVRVLDVFDEMIEVARRAHDRRTAAMGQSAPQFVPPFTPAQVQAGRDYRALVEWRAAGGVKLSRIDGRTGGGSDRDFMDRYAASGTRLAAIHARIGNGVAMALRRLRPSGRGDRARAPIHDRVLVTMVCLGGKTVGEVLKAHGWAVKGDTREAARRALAAALDRMQGYRDRGAQNTD